MSRHVLLIAAGCMILVAVWFAQVIRPKFEHPTITVTVDGQLKTMDKEKIESAFQELRNRADAARKEADALKAKNAELLAAIEQWQAMARHGGAAAPPKGDPAGTGEATGDKDEKLKKLLEGTEWTKYIGAIVAWIEADEEAKRSGKPPSYDSKTILLLSEYTVRMKELANLLGVENYEDVAYHEKVAPSFMKAWVQAMGVTLTDDQKVKLDDVCLTFSRSRVEEMKGLGEANRLDKLAWEAGRDLKWGQSMQGILSPEQYEQYSKPMGGNAFWGRSAARRDIAADSAAGASRMVGDFWAKSFGLGDAARTTVDEVASRYVQDVQRRQQEFQARYAGNAPREEQMRLQIDLLRLQADAERQLGQRLTLTPEQQERVKSGTGTVLQIGLK